MHYGKFNEVLIIFSAIKQARTIGTWSIFLVSCEYFWYKLWRNMPHSQLFNKNRLNLFKIIFKSSATSWFSGFLIQLMHSSTLWPVLLVKGLPEHPSLSTLSHTSLKYLNHSQSYINSHSLLYKLVMLFKCKLHVLSTFQQYIKWY